MNMINNRYQNEKASVLVEMVISVPVLLIMFFGIFDIAKVIMLHTEISRFGYELSRFSAVLPGLNLMGKSEFVIASNLDGNIDNDSVSEFVDNLVEKSCESRHLSPIFCKKDENSLEYINPLNYHVKFVEKDTYNQIEVTLVAPYELMIINQFVVLSKTSLTVKINTPYLYPKLSG